jgi:hypothetical protein
MRRSLNFAQKLSVIVDLEGGSTHQQIADKYGVSRPQITALNKRETQDKIKAHCRASPKAHSKRHRVTGAKHKELEGELLDWFIGKRQKKLVVTTASLQDKALRIRDRLVEEAMYHAGERNLQSFVCSNRWIGDFKKRHHLILHSAIGTEDTISPSIVISAQHDLKVKLSLFHPRDIYNADESSFFYRQLPTKSLVLCGTPCKEQIQAKDRMTILLCCSAMGEKMRPLVIGKSERPRALKNLSPVSIPCIYRANTTAWITRKIFEEWLQNLNDAMKAEQRQICLILDNFSGHILQRSFSNVQCVYLPPGMTSVLQPLDCGIIHSFKARYKKILAERYLQDEQESQPSLINIREAIEYASRAWNSVTDATIMNCWQHANIFHRPSLAELAFVV